MTLVQTIMLPSYGGGMMNQEEKRAYNRAYAIANKARIEANRAARRAGLGADVRRCSVPGCNGVYDAQGYCGRHYMAFRRNGDPELVLQKQHHGKTLAERMELRTRRGPDCWDWTGARNPKGYGVIPNEGEVLAHRVAYALACGPIPDGLFVLHRCDNPSCVNPDHLFLGTKADNNADMDAKGRRRNAPRYGSKNGMAKLDEAAIMAIRASDARGVDLARRYGVSQTTIGDIRKRRIWKQVP